MCWRASLAAGDRPARARSSDGRSVSARALLTEGDEADSDADSWLVDDDEIEESVPDDRDLSPSLLDIPLPSHKMKTISPSLPDISYSASKRKAEATDKQPEKKRKVVVPLVPYTKGPLWESVIGNCKYDPFKPYRIQLFNGMFLTSF